MSVFEAFHLKPVQIFGNNWQPVKFPDRICKFVLAIGEKGGQNYYVIFGANFLRLHIDQWEILKKQMIKQEFSQVSVLGGAWISKLEKGLYIWGRSDLGSLRAYEEKVKELIQSTFKAIEIEMSLE